MSAQIIRRAVAKYAGHHGMSVEGAELMPVKALIGWLEAEERREERERLKPASEKTEAELSQPPTTVLRKQVRNQEDRTDGDHDDRTDR